MADEEIQISELEFRENLSGDDLLPVETSTDTFATSLTKIKDWLKSFFVSKTGDETIAGIKTFINKHIYKNSTIPLDIYAPTIDKSITPTSNQSCFLDFKDKNGERVGVIGVQQRTDGSERLYLQIGNVGGMSVLVDGQGNISTSAPASQENNSIVTTVAKNKAQNGYYKLGNGLIIQWGYATFNAGGTTITLPTPFSSTNYSITHSALDAVSTYCVGMLVSSRTATNFVAHGWNTSSRQNINNFWLAIGY